MTKLTGQTIRYSHQQLECIGYMVQPDVAPSTPRPGILVTHAWGGRDTFAEEKALRLAEKGYCALAIDLYGHGRQGHSPEENAALMQPLMTNRPELQARMRTALQTLQQQPGVDAGRIAAIGYCFGGLAVLDLARSGTDIRGVVSFHGLLNAPENQPDLKIGAKVLALHGYDDPMATPEQLTAFANELTQAGADWQIHAYGHTVHAFTNPQAQNPDFGTVYNASAEKRSWESMLRFLAEVLEYPPSD